ncbi:MAG: hypothetical protein ABFR32_08885 [Bacteroidota bacterium]
MKKLTFILAFVLSAFIGNFAIAQQGVSKAELLTTLNNVDDLGYSKEKTSDLNNFNKNFVDDVYDITGSNKSDEDKIKGLKNLRDNNKDNLLNILGEDGYKDFKRSMKRQLKPLKRRSKLLKFII